MSREVTPPESNSPAAEEAKAKKTLWETILTATPILLTIIATLLAGQASGQMTKAQYHRAVAAQNESKSGSQWAFFQAKKQRGTMLEMAILSLRANFGSVPTDPKDLVDYASRLVAALDVASARARELAEEDKTEEPIRKRASSLAETLDKQKQRAVKLQRQMEDELKKAEKEKAFSFLNTSALPDEDPKANPIVLVLKEAEKANAAIPRANNIVLRKRNEPEGDSKAKAGPFENKKEWDKAVQKVLKTITDAQLVEAIDNADKRATKFEDLSGPKEKVYRAIENVLKQQLILCGEFDRETRRFFQAVGGGNKSPKPKEDKGKDSNTLTGVRSLVESAEDLNQSAKQITNSFAIAQLDYNYRRYDREARYNQGRAILYELRVSKSALTSDGHIKASEMFFYGMLAAQAGVTIATFALAVRQKSVLWLLATGAGLAAMGIGGYVFLSQLP